MIQQEESRFVTMRRQLLDERETRKKDKQTDNNRRRLKSFEGNTIVWPEVGANARLGIDHKGIGIPQCNPVNHLASSPVFFSMMKKKGVLD